MKSWYAVQTRSNYEAKVHASLTGAGIHDLYPAYQKRSHWKDHGEQLVTRPLFPSYLFVEIALAEKAAVVSITGVCQILGGRDPLAVPEYEIRQVQLLMASPELLRPAISYVPINGDQVEITAGAFEGVSGTVERWEQRQSRVEVTVRIQSLMAAAKVQVDAECLRRIKTVC